MAKRTPKDPIAARLAEVVAKAERDFDASCTLRERNFERGRDRCAQIVEGIRGRAHGWCVDFKGTSDDLVRAGLARPDWFNDAVECKRVIFGGLRIELYRPRCYSVYELSIEYPNNGRAA